MVSDAVLILFGEAMVESRERLLKTTPPKTIKELMKTITSPEGVKTASRLRKMKLRKIKA